MSDEHDCPWEGCKRSFPTDHGMKIHHARVHGVSLVETEGEYDCPWDGCRESLETEHGLKVHHARVHGESLCDFREWECRVCGKEQSRLESQVDDDIEPKYCSEACRQADSGVSLICTGCGDTYTVNPARADSSQYCTLECFHENKPTIEPIRGGADD